MRPILRILVLLCGMACAVAFGQSASLTLKTADGTELRGLVMATTADEVTLQNSSGVFTLRRSQLTAESKAALAKLEAPDDAAELRKKIAEQERTIAALRTENQQLRAALAQDSAASSSASNAPPVANARSVLPLAETNGTSAKSSGYWISSTGKRHNAGCRYYQSSKGRPGNVDEGVACKICGG